MRLTVEPPLRDWTLASPRPVDRGELAALVNASSSPAARWPAGAEQRLVATGHQPWLWHPGILAKDLAAAAFARKQGAAWFHLVVDHDLHDALKLQLPVRRGQRLDVHEVTLAPVKVNIPLGAQPPAPRDTILQSLRDTQAALGSSLRVNLQPIIDAFAAPGDAVTLGEQVSAVLCRLREPYTGPTPIAYGTKLARLASFQSLVDSLLADPPHFVALFNAAVTEHPTIGIAPLRVEPDRVELPLWAIRWEQPRLRVFADLADRTPQLTLETGEPITDRIILAPKAVLLTAFLRSTACDLFIHGTGGAQYDRITEAVWRAWRGTQLAPMAVATADLHLPLDAPVATREDLTRAQWWAHHVPHNVDRALSLGNGATSEKRKLLAQMHDDHDRQRRAASFKRLHEINHQLATAHATVVESARADVDTARAGVANRAIAQKRDWCFAFYPPDALRELAAALQP